MKSILISIKPQWCEKIANGEKTIEVSKSAPKEVPFKAYIYCTKTENKWSLCDYEGAYENSEGEIVYAQQHIIGEFICDKVDEYFYTRIVDFSTLRGYFISDNHLAAMCLSYGDVMNYGKGRTLYGLHISDLKIYDQPKELSEFRKSGFMTEEEWLAYLYPHTHCHYAAWAKKFEITRPPQSYMFVEEVQNDSI